MKSDLLLLSLSIILPVVTACTPDQINSAIEACQGDPECYEIIDDAIEEELESRGISGGKMTNVELNTVYGILDAYTSPLNSILLSMANAVLSETENSALNNQLAPYREDLQKLTQSNYLILEHLDYLKLRDINVDNLQLFIQNQTKYIIYKFSSSQFIYEILADQLITIKIDTDLEAVFINNTRLFKNATSYIQNFFTNPPSLGFRDVHAFENVYKIVQYNDALRNDFEFQALDVNLNIFYTLYLTNNTESNIATITFGIVYLNDDNQSWGYGYDYDGNVLKSDLFDAMKNTSLILRIGSGLGNNFNPNFNFSESEEYFELINTFEDLFSVFLNALI